MSGASSVRQLRVEQVTHSYGNTTVVRNVSLDVEAGQVHCLLGPSGSGKSTLLRVIAGLETPDSGTVSIGSAQVTGEHIAVPPEQRAIGFVFQDYALFPHLNVRRNILYGMPPGTRAERHAKMQSLLERVELADAASAMPHTLSGGEQQRVALARALAREPGVMLLDEPFSSLDVRLRTEVRETTLRVLREFNTATLLVTHDPQESMRCADQVSVIRAGQIIQTATPQDLYFFPADRETAETFGVINTLKVRREGTQRVTVLGCLPGAAALDDSNETALLRPECIALEPAHGPTTTGQGTVCTIEPEGGTNLIGVQLSQGPLVKARCLAPGNWNIGAAVRVRLRNP
ncbi:MAG: ABC transporter ATP-binding protein [Planctomycetaceae bacterium]|nr:ABC transporter ATP-binding protein [Planctomycetaceae bacterium]